MKFTLEKETSNGHRRRIDAFDLDWTLAVTKSGKPFPKNQDDFLIWNKKLPFTFQNTEKKSPKSSSLLIKWMFCTTKLLLIPSRNELKESSSW
jgi:hypothetical protein